MKELNEELLEVWLRMSTIINNERLVSDMPFNEALVCNVLYNHMRREPERLVTATDLCRETRMLKSLMNRTLNSLEEKKIIKRERSQKDKRQVFVSLDLESTDIYSKQHEKIIELLDTIIEKLGKEKSLEIIKLFTTISETLEGVM